MDIRHKRLLGKQLQLFRKERGLTQEELAERLGMNPKYIQFIENGKRSPSLKTLLKISVELNTKVKDFFTF